MKAKSVSLKGIVFAIVWIGALSLLRGFVPVLFPGKEFGLSIGEITFTGGIFVILFTPVYVSIWLDKKFGLSGSDDDTGGKDA